MQRDKSWDKIFLHNFFKDRLEVYTHEQPRSDTQYETMYFLATEDWLPLKKQLDTYQIPQPIKENLKALFELAQEHFFYVGEEHFESKMKMSKLWERMRHIAINTRHLAKTHQLYSD